MNHFLVFIGGTGAKCAEAFVQLAAAGALGGREHTFHILTADVDATNGNRKLALEVINRYKLLREEFPASGNYEDSPLFGPKIEHYDWHIQMPDVFKLSAGVDCLNAMRTLNHSDELELMRLFYTDEEMSFDFAKEGFHAIPAIGAPVMQYILEEELGLEPCKEFLSVIRSEVSAHSHLIFIGSIFGGTGACGVPSLMRYFANKLRSATLSGSVHIASVLMLPYYHFADPGNEDGMAVRARKFYNNAKGALAFYRDKEKELMYEKLYLLGSPVDFNMGAYHPGMDSQKNPPTIVEWEAALAVSHCVSTPIEPASEPKQYLHGIRCETETNGVSALKLSWGDFSLPIAQNVAAMIRFTASYMGYYRQYILKNINKQTALRPFFSELILPYLRTTEMETKAFASLESFLERFWVFVKQSMSFDQLKQTCVGMRMVKSEGYAYKSLAALTPDLPSPSWRQVEDAIFDGIKPYDSEENAAPEYNAGLFIHGLYAQCKVGGR